MSCFRSMPFKGLTAFLGVLLLAASISSAADFTLSWDSNYNDDSGLIGYNVYYKEGASILENPDDSVMIYIPLSEEGFDPENPNYTITGLEENVKYYFTVTAMSEDDESSMSNEVSAISSNLDSNISSSDNSYYENDPFRAGCFIGALNK